MASYFLSMKLLAVNSFLNIASTTLCLCYRVPYGISHQLYLSVDTKVLHITLTTSPFLGSPLTQIVLNNLIKKSTGSLSKTSPRPHRSSGLTIFLASILFIAAFTSSLLTLSNP